MNRQIVIFVVAMLPVVAVASGVVLFLSQQTAGVADGQHRRMMEEALDAVERQNAKLADELTALRRRVKGLEAAAAVPVEDVESAEPRIDVEALVRDAVASPSPELAALLAQLVDETRANEAEEKKQQRVARKLGSIKGGAASMSPEIDHWVAEYGLQPTQVAALEELAKSTAARHAELRERGAGKWEYGDVEVESQGEVRRIVGDEVYRATQRERRTQETRRKVNWLSSSVGGLSEEQHLAIDSIVDSGVEGTLDAVIRLRSEPITPEDREALSGQVRQADTDTWTRMRDQVLTDTQRRRLPAGK